MACPYRAIVISAASTMSKDSQPKNGEPGKPTNLNTSIRLCVATTELIENQPIAAIVLMKIGSIAPNWPKLGRDAMIPAEPVFGPMMLDRPTTQQPSTLPIRMAEMDSQNERP